MIRKKTDSGWWEGELQIRGKRRQIGWFPATYVKVLQSGRLSGRSTPVSGGKIPMSEAILGMFSKLNPSIIFSYIIFDEFVLLFINRNLFLCVQTK